MSFRVFVSYSTHDLSHAAKIKDLLDAAGAVVSVAEYSLPAGAAITPVILDEIKTCDLFVLLWSQSARTSEWVPQEIGAAKAHQRSVIPLLLQEGMGVPGFLTGTKYLSMHGGSSNPYEWLRQHVVGQAAEKSKAETLVLLGIAGVMLWALSQGK